jgi:hypothetical protein
MVAAAFNRSEMVARLLARGASPEQRDASGLTATDIARGMGAVDVLALLSR